MMDFPGTGLFFVQEAEILLLFYRGESELRGFFLDGISQFSHIS